MSKILVPTVPKGNGSGNTRNRPNPAVHWFCTWNNYLEDDLKKFDSICRDVCKRFCWQREIGSKSGIHHVHAYVHFSKKSRPMSVFKFTGDIHWEKARGTRPKYLETIDYVTKERTRDGEPVFFNIKRPKKVKTIVNLYPWQQKIVDMIKKDPDDRSIHWYWESKGNAGKSALVKYLCVHHGALICAGKAADMKYLVAKYMEDNDGVSPEILIFDVPRSYKKYISYTGIEEIKNGCFCSTKYECGMVITNPPHVLVFANTKPDIDQMSKDRWCIEEIGRSQSVTLSTPSGEVEELPA